MSRPRSLRDRIEMALFAVFLATAVAYGVMGWSWLLDVGCLFLAVRCPLVAVSWVIDLARAIQRADREADR